MHSFCCGIADEARVSFFCATHRGEGFDEIEHDGDTSVAGNIGDEQSSLGAAT
jgi:hypothetical protein